MFYVHMPIDEIHDALRATRNEVTQRQPELMEVLGVQILSNAQLDYRAKSRGGTGSDGIKWTPLADSTVERKNRRGKKKRGRRRRGSDASPTGKTTTDIGVDTGLQRNSAAPGYSGGDGKGGNVHEFDALHVTVGFGRTYSEYFDDDRPLLPDPMPPEWVDELNDIVNDHYTEILDKELP